MYFSQNYQTKCNTTFLGKTHINDLNIERLGGERSTAQLGPTDAFKLNLYHITSVNPFPNVGPYRHFESTGNGVNSDSMSCNLPRVWVFSTPSVLSDPGKCLQVPLGKVRRMISNKHFFGRFSESFIQGALGV